MWRRINTSFADPPARAFVALSLGFGLGLVALIPPFQAPDEIDHFRRAYQISEGIFVPERRPGPPGDPDRLINVTGGELPRSLLAVDLFFEPLRLRPDRAITLSTLRTSLDLEVSPDRRVFVPFANTALASPLPYLPQAVGIAIASWFTDAVVAHAYAGRIANLLSSTVLVALAIRMIPICKWGLMLLALAPTALAQSASLSSDALTNALSFLLIAVVLRCGMSSALGVERHRWLLLVALSAGIGLVKQMYVPLPLALLMVPAERLGGRRRQLAATALLLMTAVAAAALWSWIARAIYSPIEPGIDPTAQLAAIVAAPAALASAFGRTLVEYGPALGWQYLGVLGTLDTELPHSLLLAYAVALFVIACVEFDGRASVTRGQRLVALFVAALTSASVCLSVHLIADKVGQDVIWLQGRYFVPIGPLLLVAVHGAARSVLRVSRRARAALPVGVVIFLVCIQVATAWSVSARYLHAPGRRPSHFEWIATDLAFREAGQTDGIVRNFELALGHPPAALVERFEQATTAEAARRVDDALVEYREIMRLAPQAPIVPRRVAMLLLGRPLSSAGAAEAERLARRACRDSRFEDPRELELLASALFAQGRDREATSVLRAAAERARAVSDEPVVRKLERRPVADGSRR